MKSLPLLALVLALAGCSSLEHMSYGSWLEEVGDRKPAAYPLTPEEKQVLRTRADQLHARADDIRLKLSGEKDRVQRVAYMRQLEDIGRDLRPIDRELRRGGTDNRRYPPPPDYTQAGGQ
jgi:hypothetical protein